MLLACPMKLRILAFLVLTALAPRPAQAQNACNVGDVCAIQGPLFGCRDFGDIKRWIDTYVDQDRETAERYIDAQVAAGECVRFHAGEKLRLVRYLGLRRLEVRRPGESQSFIMLLK